MVLPEVDEDALTLLLFGPGYGELALVRAPPGKWLVVDGCSADSAGYGQRVLEHYDAHPSLVLFSHPHKDHANGLREVIESATNGYPPENWPKLGMVPALDDARAAGDTWDVEAGLDQGVVQQVVATIVERWRQNPKCRWKLELGTSERLGDATVQVISPTAIETTAAIEAWERNARHDWNRAATALWITWRGRSILLGADLVEEPGRGWTSATGQAQLHTHDVYKIAHHGARKGIGPQITRALPPKLRAWVGTPFVISGLPKCADNEAMQTLLAIKDEIHFTGLPVGHEEQALEQRAFTRAELKAKPPPPQKTTEGFPDCFVSVTLRSSGEPKVHRGPGSILHRP